MKQSDLIFALDIGTRSVIGVVGEVRGEMFHVLYMAKEEHSKRAMMDGQIEDIEQVAKIVKVIKSRLEEQIGHPLTRVCVAAAGRSLRMERARALVELGEVQTVTDDFISQLEAVAIAEAEEKLSEHNKDQRFYLVGYTVAQYLLDRYPMTTIKGHNGRIMEAEVVATFLPSQVVEGLYSVVQIAGLEVASLTLEPIAALNATIPPDLRLLNLVLVDIGAGTSDIAVCRDGSVVGYTMATTAGDEITEMLMKHFLIDFTTAENLKTNLSTGEIKFVNVLGKEENTSGQQISEAIAEATKSLVKEVAKEIRSINGCSPAAVFMAGGGSKLEGITEMLAGYLEIQNHRIAVAGSNYNRTIVSENFQLDDPEYATPLGIAVSAGLGLINDSYHITLNGKGAKLFRSGSLTLLDILMMNGYTAAALIGRTGKNLAIMINGNKKIIRGKPSIPGILRLNGEPAVAGALVSAGDIIEFVPAIDGESAACTLQELLGDYAGQVLLNGVETSWNTPLKNGDAITTVNSTQLPTVAQRRNNRPLSASELRPVDAQGNPVPLPASAVQSFDQMLASRDGSQDHIQLTPEDKTVGSQASDNIIPIPRNSQASATTVEEQPTKTPMRQEPAVLKPVPESLSAVDYTESIESQRSEEVTPVSPMVEETVEQAPPVMEETPVEAPPVMEETPVEAPPVVEDAPEELFDVEEEKAIPRIEDTQALPQISVATEEISPKAEEPEPLVESEEMTQALPLVESLIPEPVAPPVEEPVAPQVEEPVAPPVEEPVAPPVEEPVAPPVEEPVAPPVEEPVAPPVEEPVAPPVEELEEVESIQEQMPVDSPAVLPDLTKDTKPQGEESPEKSKGRASLTQGMVTLNGVTMKLPPKADGSPYYLMDLLDKTDIDFRRVSKPILMLVNGQEGFFVQHLHQNDDIIIEEQK